MALFLKNSSVWNATTYETGGRRRRRRATSQSGVTTAERKRLTSIFGKAVTVNASCKWERRSGSGRWWKARHLGITSVKMLRKRGCSENVGKGSEARTVRHNRGERLDYKKSIKERTLARGKKDIPLQETGAERV